MRILVCHNYYQFRGGEDQSFEQEVAMLRQRGHEVEIYTRHNDDIKSMSRTAIAQRRFGITTATSRYRRSYARSGLT